MDLKLVKSSAEKSAASLAPGFRFHPTDEELVWYYLRRKICNKPFRFDAISEIDIYKVEPWDLPGKSRIKSRDLEWYFFSVLDKKYGNGSRTNRATDKGYWKTTGKDRAVYHRTQIVGMKKTLVYHNGRAPRGERTNWVMHEYRIIDEEMEKAGISQDAFVLCRIFRKSGSGPKNGENYGAPFIEEEWEDDELTMVPKDEYAEELPVSDDACPDAYLDENDLEQILSAIDPLHDAPVPFNFAVENEVGNVEESTNFISEAREPLAGVEQHDGRNLYNLPVQYQMDSSSVEHEYTGESSNVVNSSDLDFLLNEPFLDAMDNPPTSDGAFIETNDLKQPVDLDPTSFEMLDEYLQFFDATDGNMQNMGFDYSNILGSEELHSDHASLLPCKDENEGIIQENMEGKQPLDGKCNDVPFSSKQQQTNFGSDYQYTFVKQAGRMLKNIPAPPALALEFPAKDTSLHTSASASSFHVTTGMIHIRNATLGGSEMDWPFSKHGRANIVLSFGMPGGDNSSADLQYVSSVLTDRANMAISRGWFYFMFMWVLLFTMSFKIGTYIFAN